jgi:glucose-6-phosphate-specific signal transduction histidine kinase
MKLQTILQSNYDTSQISLHHGNHSNKSKTGKLERIISKKIVDNEENIEKDVCKKLNTIIDSHITTVQKQKRIYMKCHQDNETAKQKHQVSSEHLLFL